MPDDLFDRPETAILIDAGKRELRRIAGADLAEMKELIGRSRPEILFGNHPDFTLELRRTPLVDGGTGFRLFGMPFEGIGLLTFRMGADITDAYLEALSREISFYSIGKSETAYSIKAGREQRAT